MSSGSDSGDDPTEPSDHGVHGHSNAFAGGNLIQIILQHPALRAQFGLGHLNVDDEDDDDDEMDEDDNAENDDGDEDWETDSTPSDLTGPTRKRPRSPSAAGSSGTAEGPSKDPIYTHAPPDLTFPRTPSSAFGLLRRRELSSRTTPTVRIAQAFLPGTAASGIVDHYDHKAYCGEYSKDGRRFFCATQDYTIRLYDTTRRAEEERVPGRGGESGMKLERTIQAVPGRWTITDCDMSGDGTSLIYSSITDTVHMVHLDPESDRFNADSGHIAMHFGSGEAHDQHFGIWSVRLSEDGREIVAGATDGKLYVYDVETMKVLTRIRAHADDVNAVCFGDPSSNVLVSGADDARLRVWDRRSLANSTSRRSSGLLVGHTEGITFVSAKGDGRGIISNGKDQRMLMWDLRKVVEDTKEAASVDLSTGFDYRWESYPQRRKRLRHPQENFVRSFEGHKAWHRYVYTGSSDGRVLIFDTEADDGAPPARTLPPPKVVRKPPRVPDAAAELRRLARRAEGCCTRDVSWHPWEPVILASTWAEEQGYLIRYGFQRR
ncbi:hypothetical protein HK101_001655 [Irineochytrium annulatum]|nr:hypothetical protein HK101_001655 [Irineochytrium annulatum]